MADLTTNYLGLALDNPLVPSASPLSRSLDSARELEDAGAAAIVMYSLFEEELRQEEATVTGHLVEQETGFAEAGSYLPMHGDYHSAAERYLEQLVKLEQHLDIPIVASLNGVSPEGWLEHGKALQEAGADALELNVYYLAVDAGQSAAEIEQQYLTLLKELLKHVSIPINVKLSPQFTALPNFVKALEQAGASGIALFNRFYQPDINLDTLRVTPRLQLSTPAESLRVMHWMAILYGHVELSLAATGGIHSAEDALKMIAAGADVTHMCSALLKHGTGHLARVKQDMEDWFEESHYNSVAELKGVASRLHSAEPSANERAGYVWMMQNYEI